MKNLSNQKNRKSFVRLNIEAVGKEENKNCKENIIRAQQENNANNILAKSLNNLSGLNNLRDVNEINIKKKQQQKLLIDIEKRIEELKNKEIHQQNKQEAAEKNDLEKMLEKKGLSKLKLEETNRILEQYLNIERTKSLLHNEIKQQNIEEIENICNKIDKYTGYYYIESNRQNIQLHENENNNDINNQIIKNIFGEVNVYRKSLNFLKEKQSEMMKSIKLTNENIENLKNEFKKEFKKEIDNFNENKNILSNRIAFITEKINEIDDNKIELSSKQNLRYCKYQILDKFKNSINIMNNAQSEYIKMMEKIFCIANNFFSDANSLSSLVNPLNNRLENVFKTFNTIYDNYFRDTKNIEKSQEGLQFIKENLDTLIKNIYKEQRDINKKSKPILDKNSFFAKAREELESHQKIINDKHEEINNVLNNQLELINQIRKTNNYKEINKQKNEEIINTNIIKENENLEKIEESWREASKKVKKDCDYITTELKNTKKKFILDLLLIIDNTYSMKPYINEVKDKILDIVNKINERFPKIDVRLGFIGYTDIIENGNEQEESFIDLELTNEHKEIKEIKEKVRKINVWGGKDTAENLTGALEKAINKKWKSNARYIIIITDAPCHGKKYHNGNEKFDYYLDGDPFGRDPCEILKKFLKKHISLLCLEVKKEDTKIMFEEFEKIYQNKEFNDFECEFKVESLKDINAVKNMVDIIVNNANRIFEKFRDKEIDENDEEEIENKTPNVINEENSSDSETESDDDWFSYPMNKNINIYKNPNIGNKKLPVNPNNFNKKVNINDPNNDLPFIKNNLMNSYKHKKNKSDLMSSYSTENNLYISHQNGKLIKGNLRLTQDINTRKKEEEGKKEIQKENKKLEETLMKILEIKKNKGNKDDEEECNRLAQIIEFEKKRQKEKGLFNERKKELLKELEDLFANNRKQEEEEKQINKKLNSILKELSQDYC